MSHWEHYFHLVWTTKRRQPLLASDNEEAFARCTLRLAEEMRYEVLALNGMPDHIHLLIRTGPQIDISAFVKKVKGITSAMLNDMTHHEKNFRWQEGYFSMTVTSSQVPRVQAYIQNQKEHHREGTLHAFWERAEEEREVQNEC